jgi:hypothetical protein
VLHWQVDAKLPILGDKVERLFADEIRAALDDDHAFTLQYLLGSTTDNSGERPNESKDA